MDENPITYFGQTDYRNRRTPFGIKASDRTRHIYVIGKTGMGKSTLLENMAIQDIQSGNGLAFVDPHGKSAELLLDYVPENRIGDVLYFAPFDMEYPISFNVMEDVGPDKRHLVVNGLMSTFEKIWVDAWSARMAYILSNTLLALLEFPGSTLLGINRMLSDKEYRKVVIANVKDPSVRAFWIDEFSKYTDRYAQEATPAIQNKVGQFTSNPLIRNIIGQSKSTFDLRRMMDEKKIIIVNLSKGRVGEGNANLLGSMFITKFYLAAMSRADVSESKIATLPNSYLYVDEFQSFANKSFADILSEARKYKLNLTIAHQYIEQMEEEVRAAVFGNVGTMVTFRVGAYDAEVIEKEFAPVFTAEDLVNLGIFQIYLKLMIDGVSSSPFSATTLPPIQKSVRSFKEEVIASSRKIYGRKREDVESDVRIWHEPVSVAEKDDKKRPVKIEDKKPEKVERIEKKEKIEPRPNVPTERNKNEFSKAFEMAGLLVGKPVLNNEFKDSLVKRDEKPKENVVSESNRLQSNQEKTQVPLNEQNKDFSPLTNEKISFQQKTKRSFNQVDGRREENVLALRRALAEVLKEGQQNSNKDAETSRRETFQNVSKPTSNIFDKENTKQTQNIEKINPVNNLKEESNFKDQVSPDVIREILSSDDSPKK
jgi:hypothetical protein